MKKRQVIGSVVYFVRRASHIKIGFTNNFKNRLSNLQSSVPEPLEVIGMIPGGAQREASIHELLAKHRVGGEWFHDVPEVREAIRDLMENPGPPPSIATAPIEHAQSFDEAAAFADLQREEEAEMAALGILRDECIAICADLRDWIMAVMTPSMSEAAKRDVRDEYDAVKDKMCSDLVTHAREPLPAEKVKSGLIERADRARERIAKIVARRDHPSDWVAA